MNELQFLKKSVKIEDILAYFGYKVQETQKIEFFIHSPFRQEKTPSFKINKRLNTWYDFGQAMGGSNVDLLIKLKNWTAKEAINFLKNFNPAFSSFPPQNLSKLSDFKPSEPRKDELGINILKTQKIQNKALISYLNSRKIPLKLAKKYLQEIYFKKNEKTYFALAWQNQSGGWNWRNKYLKGCIGSNNFTFFSKNAENVSIFEGIFDFLSAVVYFDKEPSGDVIVLNSVANLAKVELSGYKRINLFFDNDKAGINAKNEIFIKNEEKEIKDYSKIYGDYKDFNEFLMNKG